MKRKRKMQYKPKGVKIRTFVIFWLRKQTHFTLDIFRGIAVFPEFASWIFIYKLSFQILNILFFPFLTVYEPSTYFCMLFWSSLKCLVVYLWFDSQSYFCCKSYATENVQCSFIDEFFLKRKKNISTLEIDMLMNTINEILSTFQWKGILHKV